MIIYIYERDRERFVYDGCKYTVNILRHKWMVWVLNMTDFPASPVCLQRMLLFKDDLSQIAQVLSWVLCPMFNSEYGI